MHFYLVDDVEGSVAYPRPVAVGKTLKNKITCSMFSFQQENRDKKVIQLQKLSVVLICLLAGRPLSFENVSMSVAFVNLFSKSCRRIN